jgi:Lon protease-like protein
MDLRHACEALPIFPLPSAVLMPGMSLPLHVFEPRYRELVSHVLDGGRLMGIATLMPGYEANYSEAPSVYDEIGIGRVVSHQALPDGRSNILLEYIGRCSMDEELPSPHAFRLVRATHLPEQADPPALPAIRSLVASLAVTAPEAARDVGRLLDLDDVRLMHELGSRLLSDSHDRRRYLAGSQATRSEMVAAELSAVLAAASGRYGIA